MSKFVHGVTNDDTRRYFFLMSFATNDKNSHQVTPLIFDQYFCSGIRFILFLNLFCNFRNISLDCHLEQLTSCYILPVIVTSFGGILVVSSLVKVILTLHLEQIIN